MGSAYCLNARSLSCEKMDELQITVETNNVSIVCVTETWFKECMDIHSLTMEGFCLERKDRNNGRGGGVACYIRNDINYKRLVDMEDSELEVIWFKIMPKKCLENLLAYYWRAYISRNRLCSYKCVTI